MPTSSTFVTFSTTTGNGFYGIAIGGGYLYTTRFGARGRVNLTNVTDISSSWLANPDINEIAADNRYVFYDTPISRIDTYTNIRTPGWRADTLPDGFKIKGAYTPPINQAVYGNNVYTLYTVGGVTASTDVVYPNTSLLRCTLISNTLVASVTIAEDYFITLSGNKFIPQLINTFTVDNGFAYYTCVFPQSDYGVWSMNVTTGARTKIANVSNIGNTTTATSQSGAGKGLVVNNGYLYIALDNNAVGRLQLSNPSNYNASYITGLTNLTGLAISNNYLYSTNSTNGVVSRALTVNPPVAPSNYTASCTSAGNLAISVVDAVNSYGDNVSYNCYLYSGPPNLSGNATNYTRLIGNLAFSSTTQGTLTGLSANTYFTYIIAQNTDGNSTAIMSNPQTYASVTNSGVGATIWNGNMYVATTGSSIYRVGLTDTSYNNASWATGQTGNYGIAAYNGYIYSVGFSNKIISRININTSVVTSNFINWSANPNLSGLSAYSAYAHKNYLYIGYDNGKIARVNLDKTTDYQIFWYSTPPVATVITGIVGYENDLYFALNYTGIYKCSSSNSSAGTATLVTSIGDTVYGMAIQWPYLFYSLYGSRNIRYVNLTNYSDNSDYAIPVAPSNNSGIVAYNNKLYSVAFYSSTITVVNLPVNVQTTPASVNSYTITSTTSGNIDISITDSSNSIYNLVKYSYYLYSSGTNNSTVLSAYTHSGLTRYDGNTTTYAFRVSNLTANQYSVYLIGNNTVGNTEPVMSNVTVYTTPLTPTIVSTSSSFAGSLVVNISDTVNSSTNQVYYHYSTNGVTYGNSGVLKTSGNTYSFTITNTGNASVLLTDVSYTLFVRAVNPLAVSTAASRSAVVYQTPRTPSAFSSISNESGNVSVTVTETSPPAFYYLNNVYYYYYLYNGTGQNQSGNSLAYANSLVALSSASNTTQFKIQGQAASNYTLYVIAKNTVGNSAPPATGNLVTVQTIPLTPTIVSTSSSFAGSLVVNISDTVNSSTNQVYYHYSTNGVTYGNSGVLKTSGNTYSFTITNTGNASVLLTDVSYTLFVRAVNPLAVSTAASRSAVVYQTPRTPSAFSSISNESGNVSVTVTETSPPAFYYLNNVYYYYYLYNGTGQNQSGNSLAYTNSLVALSSASNTTQFKIQGQAANNYTLYVIANNTVGNSAPPATGNLVSVLTTPVSFNSYTITTNTNGSVDISIIDSTNNVNNSVGYYYYLYSSGTNNSTDASAYTNSGLTRNGNTTTYNFSVSNLTDGQYTVYLIAKNTLGNTAPVSSTVNIASYTTVPSTPTIVSTSSSSAGSLVVNISDTVNSSTNQVYYQYSTDGTTYGNSGVLKSSASTYSFTITNTGNASVLLTDVSYTLFVRSVNSVGVSSPDSKAVVVYQTPRTPSAVTTASNDSGNISVTVTETSPPAFYYLNNVYYYYYLYNGTGQNQSGNSLAYTNSLVALSSASNTTQFKIQGQTANNYTVYVIAKNTVGNSEPPTTGNSVTVQTTPVSFNSYTVSSTTSGNIDVSISDSNNDVNNSVGYYYYLYDSGTNNSNLVSAYTDSGLTRNGNTTTYSFSVSALSNGQYTVYLIAKNTLGNTAPVSTSTNVYLSPSIPSIVSASSSSAGSLVVNISDSTNLSTNQVYYYYSTDGITYGNSGVLKSSGNTYSFTVTNTGNASILLTDVSYTLFVRSVNPVGVSSSDSKAVVVYQTPRTPSAVTTASNESGNISVTVTETSPPAFYYLNSVYYYYYLYNGTGQNQSGNSLAYTNSMVALSSASNTTQFKIQGQSANNYTVYVIAKNTVGNSAPPATGNSVTVQTTPVSFNSYTVSSTTSGNIDISISDSNNDANNSVGYYYYLYSSGTNNSGNVSAYTYSGLTRNSGTTTYAFKIQNQANAQYTVYLIAKNTLGNTAPVYTSTNVYLSPSAPSIVSTSSSSPGSLVVNISDSTNLVTNQVYYYYSTDGITYGNSGVLKSSGNTYSFTVTNTGNASILLTDVSYTLFVRSVNPVGVSSSDSKAVVVYQTPRTPSAVTTASNESGNISVTVTETSPPAFYNLNDVYYYYYLYNGSGQNDSGNSLAYTNSLVAFSNASNTTQFKIQGQPANNYTVYVIAKNTVGNSAPPASGEPITVQTTPVKVNSHTVSSTTSGNIDISISDSSNDVNNSVGYYYYLYNGSGQNDSGNVLSYTYSGLTRNSGTSTYAFSVENLANIQYTVYLIAKNAIGNTPPVSDTVTVYTTPAIPTIVSTSSSTAGSLVVNISDSTNLATNQVYYYYSIDGITYGNSGVLKSSGNTYSFTITDTGNASILLTDISYTLFVRSGNASVLLTDISYTLFVRSVNPVGVSPSDSKTVVVYQTPRTPTAVTTTSNESGNISVTVTETSPPAFYNLNNVYYYYYLYNGSGQNQSGNSLAYTNSSVAFSGASNTTQFKIQGQPASNYTVYVIAKNTVGNSAPPATGNLVTVLTTPVSVNASTVTSTVNGQIDISITDSNNNVNNSVGYYYYLYTSGTNNSTDISAYTYSGLTRNAGTTTYNFSVSNLTKGQYTVYLIAKNTVGSTASVSSVVDVYTYTIPLTPSIVSTSSVSAGSLVVNISDSVNTVINDVYYYYSTDGITYGNSGVLKTSGNTYSFTITNTGNASVLLTDVSYTLFVRSVNPAGVSSSDTKTVIVYQTPRTPSSISTASNESGNISITVTEISPPALYYLNNVYYYYYLYNGSGQNDSGNSLAYTNSSVAFSSASNTAQFKIQGQPARNYTVYVIAKNTVGNSAPPATGNLVTVQTTPLSFNSYTVTSTVNGSVDISISDSTNDINNTVEYYYYLYSSGTNRFNEISAYTSSGLTRNSNTTIYNFSVSNVPNGQYTVYLIAKNTLGNTTPVSANTIVYKYTLPLTPTIVSTSSSSAGRLVVNISDSVNTASNYVYYYYSTDGITYGNSGVLKTSGNTYSFTITDAGNASVLLSDISYTLFVTTVNPAGVSSPDTEPVVVYQTPRAPTAFSSVSNESGNIRVTVTETSPPELYHLNDVYYYYYLYNGTGQNQSGNSLAYTNSSVALSSASDTTQFTIEGQLANTYTLYVIARNTVGNSSPPAAGNTVTVETTPVSFNSYVVSSATSGNIDISISDSKNSVNNSVGYYYYLYDSGTNNSGNVSAYTYSGLTRNSGTTTYAFRLQNLSNKQYTVYLLAKNAVGNTVSVSANTTVYITPDAPSIASTSSSTAGSLVVNISDTTNLETNQAYYYYSTNGTTYGNSGVLKTSGNTYSFTITNTGNASVLLTDVSYTLFVRTVNPVGVSSSDTEAVIVYQTPRKPTAFSSVSNESGNISVTITETSPPAFYYLNDVYYYYYLYNGTGQNQSGNSLAYTNSLSAFSSSSNTTLFKIQGQTANSYTLYVIAKNTVGNSVPPTTGVSVTVRTTPVSFNSHTVTSTTSGNIDISISDSNNATNNSVGYYYYLYDSGTNNSGNVSAYTYSGLSRNNGTTTYAFRVQNLTHKQYTVYLIAKNSVGSTSDVSSNVTVYTTPVQPSSISTNSLSAGSLTINITDNVNSATNQVYYQYSTSGITYGNSGVLKTAGNTYSFTITNTGNPTVSLTNISYTLYIRTINSVGVSSANTRAVVVYQVPRKPPAYSATITESGNINVSVNESSAPTSYGLNGVYYYYYLYNGIGQNQSGNSLVYANSTATYLGITNNVQFKIQNLNPDNYLLYVIAKNTVGNSPPPTANYWANARVTPLSFNTHSVSSTTSGNIDITITDTNNDPKNTVGYYYYVYSSGTNRSSNRAYYTYSGITRNNDTTSSYSFRIQNLVNNQYSVYLIAQNVINSTVPVFSNTIVYTVPLAPTITTTNSYMYEPGRVTVDISDNINSSMNGAYYLYSMDGVTYGNTGVMKTTGNTYSFTISDTGNPMSRLIKPLYDTLYVKATNSVGTSPVTTYGPVKVYQMIRFRQDTYIQTSTGYRPVQELQVGDLVQTYEHGLKAITIVANETVLHTPSEYNIPEQLYRCPISQYTGFSSAQNSETFGDLIITGSHSILVDNYNDPTYYNATQEANGNAYVPDSTYRLPVCVDGRSTVYEIAGNNTLYHISLENDEYYGKYGMYANGLLIVPISTRIS